MNQERLAVSKRIRQVGEMIRRGNGDIISGKASSEEIKSIVEKANGIKTVFTKERVLLQLNNDMLTYMANPDANQEQSSQYRAIVVENLDTLHDKVFTHFEEASFLKPLLRGFKTIDDPVCFYVAQQFIRVGLASEARTGYLIDHISDGVSKGEIMRKHIEAVKVEAEGIKSEKIRNRLMVQAKHLEEKYSKSKHFA